MFPPRRGPQGAALKGRLGELSQELRRHVLGLGSHPRLWQILDQKASPTPGEKTGSYSTRRGGSCPTDLYVASLQADLEAQCHSPCPAPAAAESETPTHALSRVDPEQTRTRRSEAGEGGGRQRQGGSRRTHSPKGQTAEPGGPCWTFLQGGAGAGRRRGGNGYTGSRVTSRQKGLGALRLTTALQPPTHAGSPLHCPRPENSPG